MVSVVQAAIEARRFAHAPYSNYPVGAALEIDDRTVVTGCNVESSSFGLTTCAERVAVGGAIARGHRSFKSLAIATRDGAPPCGACRQILWDICGDLPITLVDEEGNCETTSVAELLPKPFDDGNLRPVPVIK